MTINYQFGDVDAHGALIRAESSVGDAHGALLRSILNALADGQMDGGLASRLAHTLGNVLLAVADKNRASASDGLQAFVTEVKREEQNLPTELTRQLLDGAERAQRGLRGH